ncbi:hypothetical protein [Flavobacterium anhuiense]|uniref:hypothetical protein n=1 Tax=Flavobacterium anhuiense TaxID=459526 RepID=UPI003D964817
MELSEKGLWEIELDKNFEAKNIKEFQKILYEDLDLLLYLHEILADKNVQIEENEVLAEELIMKFYLHGLTICKIGETYEFKSERFDRSNISGLIDISSLLAVVRAQLETLLMYQHLYINSNDKDEQKLRYFAWIYTALLQQKETLAKDEKLRTQKDNNLKEIETLKEKMTRLISFKKLSDRQQHSLLENGSAKLFKHWNIIFEESGFLKEGIFVRLYYILSAFSHSEGLSMIKIKNSKYFISNENNLEMTFFQTFSSLMMTSIMITNIVDKHEFIAKRFEDIDEKVRYRIHRFAEIGRSIE